MREGWSGMLQCKRLEINSCVHAQVRLFVQIPTCSLSPSLNTALPPSLPLPCPLQMANVAGSPVFSDKDRYPHFFRALPPEPGIQHAQGVVVKHFGWTEVAYIAQNEHLFAFVRKTNITHLLLCNVSAVLVF